MDIFLTKLRYDIRRMWDRRWLAAGIAWTTAAVLAGGILMIRDRYEASTKIYVDTQTALKPLMVGLAFQPDMDQQFRMLTRTLISTPNVELLYKNPQIGLKPPPPQKFDQAVEQMKQKIKVTPSGAGNLFGISYRDSDPQRAQRLVEALLTIFVESSAESKELGSKEAERFIEEQIKEYDGKLVEAENRLKEFKLRNFGVSGVKVGVGGVGVDHFTRVAALSDEVARLRLTLASAEQSRDALKRELKSENPQVMVAGGGYQLSELGVRLQTQRQLLDELLRRYTDDHPDVISARRTITQIERQQRAEAEARKSGDGEPPAASNNPVYQGLRISLANAEANVASLKSQLSVQQGRLEEIRSLASRMPQVEAELAQLNRDYEIVRKSYDQLVARREAASLGVKIDKSSHLADFRIVEPPRVAPMPVFPGRVVLAVLAMCASLAAGAGAVFALGRMRPTVDSVLSMHELSNRPVLGSISLLRSPEMRTKRQRDIYKFASVMVVFVALHAAWVLLIARHVV